MTELLVFFKRIMYNNYRQKDDGNYLYEPTAYL